MKPKRVNRSLCSTTGKMNGFIFEQCQPLGPAVVNAGAHLGDYPANFVTPGSTVVDEPFPLSFEVLFILRRRNATINSYGAYCFLSLNRFVPDDYRAGMGLVGVEFARPVIVPGCPIRDTYFLA